MGKNDIFEIYLGNHNYYFNLNPIVTVSIVPVPVTAAVPVITSVPNVPV